MATSDCLWPVFSVTGLTKNWSRRGIEWRAYDRTRSYTKRLYAISLKDKRRPKAVL
jgi:hypothetical protein